METLLDAASQEGLIYLCVIMSIIALFLAVAIFYEMLMKNKKEKLEMNKNKINIKEDTNITYEELSKDEEVRRAKEELEKVKKQLLIKEQEEKERKEQEYEETKIKEAKVENTINDKETIEDKKVINNNIYEEENIINDREIEKIVNKKLDTTYKELFEDNQIIENKVEDNKIENKKTEIVDKKEKNNTIDVSKYNKLLSNNKNENEVVTNNKEEKENKKEETKMITNTNVEKENKVEEQKKEVEEIDKISEATKERIIDDYLKKFYNESKTDNSTLAEIKDNTVNDKEEKIKEFQKNVNNDFKDKKTESVYEDLEEENAIISYDELKKAANFGYTDEEMDKYVDEKDAIISIDELEKLYKEINNIKEDSRATTTHKEEFVIPSYEYKRVQDLPEISSDKKFKKSDIISPIYGVRELDTKTKADTLTKLNEEIKRTNEFLRMLKELQKNLE